ncbi:hypothetical protein FH972_024853 [Carpinus fangiana]|uniref:Uncharacterized protein n=1 Tax=Carpinus fangiana TaxID=176857 RepID=A0A5N6KZI4_9ROSI|nr:hypothetical protein FH972_024853 [Carpinus fangiana]
MSFHLGKRKRPAAQSTRPTSSSDGSDSDSEAGSDAMRAAFARAFEKKFAPLEGGVEREDAQNGSEDLRSDASAESDFSGFESSDTGDDDDDNTQPQVQVITHTDASRNSAPALSKAELKAFMSSKVPTKPAAAAADDEDTPTEALNLKNDLALHRLISESHLLDPSKQPAKNQRQRIADLRLQALGSKSSILEQEKMPMSFRKGIAAKKKQKEESRRRDARENGIILEKETVERTRRERDDVERKRERGVGGPSIGKFKGGTLQLSKRDLGAIKGPSRGGRGGGRGGGSGGGKAGSRGRGKRR